MGNPVSHSKSPLIHRTFAVQTGQDIAYQAILVPEDGFATAARRFQQLGGKGLNITVPFKHDAYLFAGSLTQRARSAAAVNLLAFGTDDDVTGDNTDGTGLVRDLKTNGIQINGSRLLIIGAGGAVSGVLGPLLALRPKSITIANRTESRALDLAARYETTLNLTACGLTALAEYGSFDVIINGTSSGLTGEIPDLPESIVSENSCCYDMVYGNTEPVFVSWCRSQGARMAVDGLGMLVEQAAESFYIWRGVMPETAPVIELLRNEGEGGKM
jgi:shikimate dehydrogenase